MNLPEKMFDKGQIVSFLTLRPFWYEENDKLRIVSHTLMYSIPDDYPSCMEIHENKLNTLNEDIICHHWCINFVNERTGKRYTGYAETHFIITKKQIREDKLKEILS
jgi:hypothetical protein